IPAIKSIVVIGESEEEARPGFLIAVQERLGLPVQQRPLRAQVLVTEARGRTVMREMILVLRLPFQVHVPGVPVPLLRNALRAPVRPDSELGILIPFRSFVPHEGVPGRSVWACPGESRNRGLHGNPIPGIRKPRYFRRSSPGGCFPSCRIQLLGHNLVAGNRRKYPLSFWKGTKMSVVETRRIACDSTCSTRPGLACNGCCGGYTENLAELATIHFVLTLLSWNRQLRHSNQGHKSPLWIGLLCRFRSRPYSGTKNRFIDKLVA